MSKSRRKIGAAISAYTVVIVSLIFFILPMIWIIYCSFRTQASIFTGKVIPPLNEFTLENYQTIFAVTEPRHPYSPAKSFLRSMNLRSKIIKPFSR
jgi:ABC-type glycerol-3-phosphate transport system permease component